MATFNTTAYSAASSAYNALAPVYIDGSAPTVPCSGLATYAGAFGNVMCAFAVDGGDSILGGNVIVAASLNLVGGLTAITATTVVRSTYPLYYPIPTPTTFQSILALKAPWGRYSAANWSANTLSDLTGNGHDAVTTNLTFSTASGNGATASIPYLTGSTNGIIWWPAGSVPATYTIGFITSYTTTGTNTRVLAAPGGVFGHEAGARGVYYDGNNSGVGWRTAQTNTGTPTNWLNMVVTNGTGVAVPGNALVDGIQLGTNTGGGGSDKLQIGAITPGNFQFSQLIIWDQALSAYEMTIVSAALATYLATGVLQ